MLAGTLSGVEMGLKIAGIPHRPGGVAAALESLAAATRRPPDADSVLVAAHAVETLWEELKPT
jgi:hypothetical protein